MGFFDRKMTLQSIMNATGERPQKAQACTVRYIGKRYELKPESLSDKLRSVLRRPQVNTYYVVFKFEVTSETGHTHKVYVRTLPVNNPNGPVQVYCDCPDFKYRCAYGLQQHGNLFRSSSTDTRLGEAITTPPARKSSTSTLCKHSMAVLGELIQNFDSYLG